MTLKEKLIGDKDFYKMVLVIVIPIVIQNGITSFVNLLDNMMVGQVGTVPMSAVSITNQLFNVFNLTTFGSMAAVGIFGAQFAGKKDKTGIQNCFHFRLLIASFLFAAALLIFNLFGRDLILLYVNSGKNSAEVVAETLMYAQQYMSIMLVGLLPFVLSQSISNMYRENGETVLPMISSVSAVVVNFCLNYILIFGHFGFPELGIAGAAIATVISRVAELSVLVISSFVRKADFYFLNGIIRKISIPFVLIKDVAKRGTPLILNEILWSMGMAAIMQAYSTRGIEVVAAMNISQTIFNLFMTVCYAVGHAISILVGQKLGANEPEEARIMDYRLIFFGTVMCSVIGVILFALSGQFPQVYNTTEEVRALASSFLKIVACMMPISTLYMAAYFTLRSGGKTVITFLFDSCYTLVINLPLAYFLSCFTALPIFYVYLFVQLADIPKAIMGMILVVKGVWINNIVNHE